MSSVVSTFINPGVEDPGLQIHIVDVVGFDVGGIGQPLEVRQKILGDVGPDLVPRLQGGVLGSVHGETGAVPGKGSARLKDPGQDGMEHAVVGPRIDDGFPILVKLVVLRIGLITVNEVIVIHGASHRSGSGMDNVTQLPHLGVQSAVSEGRGADKL